MNYKRTFARHGGVRFLQPCFWAPTAHPLQPWAMPWRCASTPKCSRHTEARPSGTGTAPAHAPSALPPEEAPAAGTARGSRGKMAALARAGGAAAVAMAAGYERARRDPRAGTGGDWDRSRTAGDSSAPVPSLQEKPRAEPAVRWLPDRVPGARPVATPALCSGAAPARLGRAAAGSVRGSAGPQSRPHLRLCSPAEEKGSSRYEKKRMLEAKKVSY